MDHGQNDDVKWGRQLLADIDGGAFSTIRAKERVLQDISGVMDALGEQGMGLAALDPKGKMTGDDIMKIRDGLAAEIETMKAEHQPVVGEATSRLSVESRGAGKAGPTR